MNKLSAILLFLTSTAFPFTAIQAQDSLTIVNAAKISVSLIDNIDAQN